MRIIRYTRDLMTRDDSFLGMENDAEQTCVMLGAAAIEVFGSGTLGFDEPTVEILPPASAGRLARARRSARGSTRHRMAKGTSGPRTMSQAWTHADTVSGSYTADELLDQLELDSVTPTIF